MSAPTRARPPAPRPPTVTRVIAAVDDGGQLGPVARAAAAEAGRRGVGLEFVRAVDPRRCWRDARGDEVLHRAVLALPPGTRPLPELALLPTPADHALASISHPGVLLVMGTGHVHAPLAGAVGSTCLRVLHRAPGPVLVVPHLAVAAPTPRADRMPVVLALAGEVDEGALVTLAAEEAVARDVALRIVHSVRAGAFTVVFGPGAPVAWNDLTARAHLALETLLAPVRQRFPDLPTTVSVSAAPPQDLLTRVGRDAGLLVLGSRRHEGWATPAHHLTRSVLRHARCHVLAVPVGAARDPVTPPLLARP